MTSSITLYKGTGLIPEKNFALSNLVNGVKKNSISNYLDSLLSTPARVNMFTNQNYIKNALNLEINLNLGETALNLNGGAWNYCRIINKKDNGTSETPAYYFIINMEWRSKEVVKLYLLMDTINTIGANIDFTDKTFIRREHRNRWEISGTSAIGIVDKISEGITPTLYKKKETTLKYNDWQDFKWYLVYVNRDNISETKYNQVNPVKCLIAPEHSLTIFMTGDGATDPYWKSGDVYCISPIYNNTNKIGRVNAYNGSDNFMPVQVYDISEVDAYSINLAAYPATKTIVHYVTAQKSGSTYIVTPFSELYDKDRHMLHRYTGTSVTNATAVKFYGFGGKITRIKNSNNPYQLTNHIYSYGSEAQITGIDELDKTLDTLIKVVELPYSPLTYTTFNYHIIFDYPVDVYADTGSHYNFIDIKGFNLKYYESLIDISTNDFTEIGEMTKNLTTDFFTNQLRSADFETKLYNSELYSKKFIYDSFDYEFKFENMNRGESYGIRTNFKFKQISSLAITSKFLFDFSPSWIESSPQSDFSTILPISRNNEIILYTNQYLNYLRNQRDYDLKVNEAQKRNSHIIANIGMVSSVSGMAASMAGSADSAGAINSFVQGYAGMAQKGFSISLNDYLRDEAQRQKEKELLRQKTSVTGADDLGLLNYYTKGNCPKLVTYAPSDTIKKNLADLFHFKGYNAGYYGEPQIYTRLRFNYIEADISMREEISTFIARNYSQEILTDYIQRWARGLTILHSSSNIKLDFNQQYENWEFILNNYLQ